MSSDLPIRNIRWLPVRNTSEETIPPFALMYIAQPPIVHAVIRGQALLSVIKPNDDAALSQRLSAMLINGPTSILPGGTGQGTQDLPARVLVDYETPPTFFPGDTFGFVADSWKAGATDGPLQMMLLDNAAVTLGKGERLIWVSEAGRTPLVYCSAFRVSSDEIEAGDPVSPLVDVYVDPANDGLPTGIHFATDGLRVDRSGSYQFGCSTSVLSLSAPRGSLLVLRLYLDDEPTQYAMVRSQDIETDQYGANILITLENMMMGGPIQVRAGETLRIVNESNYELICTPFNLWAELKFPHEVTRDEDEDDEEDAQNEIQQVYHAGDGTLEFTLTFDGQTTSLISTTASADTVQAALEALSNIGSGNVAVTKDIEGPSAFYPQAWQVEFIGDLAEMDVETMTSPLYPPITVTVLQEGSDGE